MKMTFDTYDEIEDKISKLQYEADGWWPTVEDLETKFKTKCKSDFEFLIWILNTNPEPETEEDKLSKKKIQEILYNKLELTN